MRILISSILLCVVCAAGAFALSGCGSKASVPAEVVGEWTCDDMATDGITETGMYLLEITDDGSFRMYDKNDTETGLIGTASGNDTGKIGILNVVCQSEGFAPPACWRITEKFDLRYKVLGEDSMKLGYAGAWLIFRK